MNKDEIIKLLEQFLETAKMKQREFTANMSDVIKKELAIDFQSKILNILEYSYLYLPVNQKNLKDHYPRPSPKESKIDYIKRSDHKPNTSPLVLKEFLSYCFDINQKHSEAISYVSGEVKHRNPNNFGESIAPKLQTKFNTNYLDPIKLDHDGNLEIAGLIKSSPTSSMHMSNVFFSSPKGFLHIESLEFGGGRFEGNQIILKDGEKRLFNDWTTDCVNICQEIIDYYKTIPNFNARD